MYEILEPSINLQISYFESWLCVVMVICVAKMIDFCLTIRPLYIKDARIYI